MSDNKGDGKGMRFSEGKLRLDLFPMDARIELARVFTIGALKYEPNNWLRGMKWSDLAGPLERHWAKFMIGQNVDEETGCSHLALIAWNALALLTYQMRDLGTDDLGRDQTAQYDAHFEHLNTALGIGLSAEEKRAIKDKYIAARAAHKAKVSEPNTDKVVSDGTVSNAG